MIKRIDDVHMVSVDVQGMTLHARRVHGGRVEVRMECGDDGMSVTLSAEQSAAMKTVFP